MNFSSLFLLSCLFMIVIAFIAAIICLKILIAKKFEKIAFQKGYDRSVHSFALCFFFGIVGYLYVIALPDLMQHKKIEKMIQLLACNSSNQSNQ